MSDNWKTYAVVGGGILGAYLLWMNREKIKSFFGGVSDVSSGVGTAVSGTGSAVSSVATDTAEAYQDVLSVTNPIRATTDAVTGGIKGVASAIGSIFKGSSTQKSSAAYWDKTTFLAAPTPTIKELFQNPTQQSFLPDNMSIYAAPMSKQNTTALAKQGATVKTTSGSVPLSSVIGRVVPKEQSIAFKKGYIK